METWVGSLADWNGTSLLAVVFFMLHNVSPPLLSLLIGLTASRVRPDGRPWPET